MKINALVTGIIGLALVSFSCTGTKTLTRSDLSEDKEGLLISGGKLFSVATVVGGGGSLAERLEEQRRLNRVAEQTKKLHGIEGIDFASTGDGSFRATIPNDILFAFDSYSLSDNSRASLGELGAILAGMPDARLDIRGHTDNVGTEQYNDILSLNRALAVGNFLRTGGVAHDRIRESGAAFSEPVASNDNAEGRRLNRRVEIIISGVK